MNDEQIKKRKAFLIYQIKSRIVKYIWYILEIVLVSVLAGILWSLWFLFGLLAVGIPVSLMIAATKPFRNEIKQLSEDPDAYFENRNPLEEEIKEDEKISDKQL